MLVLVVLLKVATLPDCNRPKVAMLPDCDHPKVAMLPHCDRPKVATLPDCDRPKVAMLPNCVHVKLAILLCCSFRLFLIDVSASQVSVSDNNYVWNVWTRGLFQPTRYIALLGNIIYKDIYQYPIDEALDRKRKHSSNKVKKIRI